MARPSSIEQLPPDILEQLQALLRDPRVTQLEATRQINAILEQAGEDPVSKSAVNRYAVRMEEVGARLRQSREMASMWIGKLGNAPQGEVGQLLNEVIRTLAFETTMRLAEEDEPVPPGMLNKLALAVQRLEAAANLNQEREKKIREEERKRVAEEAAQKVDKSLSSAGMSKEARDAIKAEILGL
jgi:hypothetical protein